MLSDSTRSTVRFPRTIQKPRAESYGEQTQLIELSKPIRCYRNLHKGAFSAKQGVVRFHANTICLKNVQFLVSEKGRQRVIAEQAKNVHSYIEGTLCEFPETVCILVELFYNPYVTSKWIEKESGRVVEFADCVLLQNNKAYLVLKDFSK